MGGRNQQVPGKAFFSNFLRQTVNSLYSSNFLYLVLVNRNKFAVNLALFPGGQHNTHKKATSDRYVVRTK